MKGSAATWDSAPLTKLTQNRTKYTKSYSLHFCTDLEYIAIIKQRQIQNNKGLSVRYHRHRSMDNQK